MPDSDSDALRRASAPTPRRGASVRSRAHATSATARLAAGLPAPRAARSRAPPSTANAPTVEVNVVSEGPCLAKISFSVPAAEFENEVRKGLAEVRKSTRMKGFRPGKAPLATVQKLYGPNAREEAKQHFVRMAFQRAVQDKELKPLGNPRVTLEELKQVEIGSDQDFQYEFEADLRPSFELGEYKGLAIESQLAPVLDEEVEEGLAHFRRRQARPEPAGEEGLAASGMAICKLELLHEGQVVLERDGLRLNAESALPGTDPEAWKQALTGAVQEAVVSLPMTLPSELENEAARGQQGEVRLTLTQVFKLVEPSDEELFALTEVADLDGLRAKLRENMELANRTQEDSRIEGALLEQVVMAHDFELPAHMVADQVRGRLAELRSTLEAQELPAEQIESQVAAAEAEARGGAERSVRAYFVLEAIAQKEELRVTDEEMLEELRTIAARNQAELDEVVNFYRQQNQMNQLALELAERKIRRFLREHATIQEPR